MICTFYMVKSDVLQLARLNVLNHAKDNGAEQP